MEIGAWIAEPVVKLARFLEIFLVTFTSLGRGRKEGIPQIVGFDVNDVRGQSILQATIVALS
jgi:hypothetical protein